MTTYTNPTGTFSATAGDDTFVFDTLPIGTNPINIDALGGSDVVSMQFSPTSPMSFFISDPSNIGELQLYASVQPYGPYISIANVESLQLQGGSANDQFTVQLGSNIGGLSVNLDGGAGQDSLNFDWSKQSIGLNFIVNGTGISSSWGTFSNFEKFTISGGSGNDTITTGAGDDNISTGTGIDTVNAGAGNDYVNSESSGGTFDGGSGTDAFSGNFYASTVALSVNAAAAVQVSNGVTATNFETVGVTTGSGDDVFAVSRTDGTYDGGSGFNTLTVDAPFTSSVGVMVQEYSGGILDGSAGSINFNNFEVVTIAGSQFDDQFIFNANYGAISTNISFDAGAGNDTLIASWATFAASTNFVVSADGSVSSNLGHFTNFETYSLSGGSNSDTLVTGGGNDTLVGNSGADHLDGGAGNDTVYGGTSVTDDDGAADVLIGGAGNDTIGAGFGDSVDGGSGTDTLWYNAATATSGINANFATVASGGTITIGGATITGVEQIGQVSATNFDDTVIIGGASDATVYGLAGNDHLTGGIGSDRIYGGDGDDTITGGGGTDLLVGGQGNDVFVDTALNFWGDTIQDFGVGDAIIFKDANPSTFTFSLSGNQLTYSGGFLTISTDLPGKLVASAAPGGGVELKVQLPPLVSVDQIANQLTDGFWDGDRHHWAVTQGGTLTVDISTLTSAEQTLARAALQEWTDIIGVQFKEVSSGAQIEFNHLEGPDGPVAQTMPVWSNGIMTSATVQISQSWVNSYGTSLNGYSFETYVHEIGHALGLGHAGNYNFDANYGQDALFENDSTALSVMSYFDQSENYYFAQQHFSPVDAVTPMQADIVAMQSLYGLSATTRAGDSVYGYNSNVGGIYDATNYQNVAFTIFDSGGIDTLDYSRGGSVLLNLNPETFSNVDGYTGNLSIARGTVIENAIGGALPDTIIGNSVNNVLTGNGGADVLTGGAGNDIFLDTEAGHAGDTITDFSAGDGIVFSDASLANFTFGLSGQTLNYTGGSLTLNGVSGHLAAEAAAGGGVELVLLPSRAALSGHSDFNGDGRDDVVLHNSDGTVTTWIAQADGSFVDSHLGLNPGTSWQLVGTGNFNGDTRDDVLWREADGTITDWISQADGTFKGNHLNLNPGVIWHVIGTGDFNGDGRTDILWQNDDGTITNWLAQADGSFTGSHLGLNPGLSWHVVGTGDFNGDSRADILWQNDSGMITEWLAQSDGSFAGHPLNLNPGTSWHVVGTGDFNADGMTDILWQNGDGTVTDWIAQANGSFTGSHLNLNPGTSWHVAAIGDFNGDNRDDIFWQNDSGAVTEWQTQSDGSFAGHPLGLNPGTSWHTQDAVW